MRNWLPTRQGIIDNLISTVLLAIMAFGGTAMIRGLSGNDDLKLVFIGMVWLVALSGAVLAPLLWQRLRSTPKPTSPPPGRSVEDGPKTTHGLEAELAAQRRITAEHLGAVDAMFGKTGAGSAASQALSTTAIRIPPPPPPTPAPPTVPQPSDDHPVALIAEITELPIPVGLIRSAWPKIPEPPRVPDLPGQTAGIYERQGIFRGDRVALIKVTLAASIDLPDCEVTVRGAKNSSGTVAFRFMGAYPTNDSSRPLKLHDSPQDEYAVSLGDVGKRKLQVIYGLISMTWSAYRPAEITWSVKASTGNWSGYLSYPEVSGKALMMGPTL